MTSEPKQPEPSKHPASPEKSAGPAASGNKAHKLSPEDLKKVAGGAGELPPDEYDGWVTELPPN